MKTTALRAFLILAVVFAQHIQLIGKIVLVLEFLGIAEPAVIGRIAPHVNKFGRWKY